MRIEIETPHGGCSYPLRGDVPGAVEHARAIYVDGGPGILTVTVEVDGRPLARFGGKREGAQEGARRGETGR